MNKKFVVTVAVLSGLVATQEIKSQGQDKEINQNTRVEMKTNITKDNRPIENRVVACYKFIENGVVTGYKKIENGVVSGFKKVEDKFVDNLFRKDEETTDEAKARLKNM